MCRRSPVQITVHPAGDLKYRNYHRSPMQTEKSQPEGKRMVPETRFTEFPALSVDPRVILKATKSILKRHMINRILHSWSFHMKFVTPAEGFFHKFYIK